MGKIINKILNGAVRVLHVGTVSKYSRRRENGFSQDAMNVRSDFNNALKKVR